MMSNYRGLDVLRGIGIWGVLVLHTAFYYYDGIFDLDFDNPPLIITLIGLFLMFAGMFAMISGFVHNYQTQRRASGENGDRKKLLLRALIAGLFILAVAYAYFLITGPGIVDFDNSRFDNSVLVELIRNGRFIAPSLARTLYVDSLVMIGTNIILLGIFNFILAGRRNEHSGSGAAIYYIGALIVLAISLLRIPLYDQYLSARENGNKALVLLLNRLVNKNNPILPYFAFTLLGAWMSAFLGGTPDRPGMLKRLSGASGIAFFVAGTAMYIFLPDTMLERSIDMKWYSIMLAQIGLFTLLILLVLTVFDFGRKSAVGGTGTGTGFLTRFFYRFGVAGLSIFFIEQLFSQSLLKILKTISGNLYAGLGFSLLMGLLVATFWGFVLMLWEKAGYAGGLEYLYVKLMGKFGGSTKGRKLTSPIAPASEGEAK